MPIRLSVQQARFAEVAAALKAEAGGAKMMAEMRVVIRAVLAPGVAEVRQGILEMPVKGIPHRGDPLRPAVAKGVKVGIKTAGRLTGARVYISKRGMPRNFADAPRDLNKPSWEHPAGRGGPTVVQVGAPGYFDQPLQRRVREYRTAITAVVERMAARVVK